MCRADNRCRRILDGMSYQSVKFIEIRNWKLAFINIFLKLGILVFIFVYTVYIKQGYQEFDNITGTVTIKIKGASGSNNTFDRSGRPEYFAYDAVDLVQPPVESNAFSLVTRLYRTSNQTRGICPDYTMKANKHGKCVVGAFSNNGQVALEEGVYYAPDNTTVCQVYAWCNIEPETL